METVVAHAPGILDVLATGHLYCILDAADTALCLCWWAVVARPSAHNLSISVFISKG